MSLLSDMAGKAVKVEPGGFECYFKDTDLFMFYVSVYKLYTIEQVLGKIKFCDKSGNECTYEVTGDDIKFLCTKTGESIRDGIYFLLTRDEVRDEPLWDLSTMKAMNIFEFDEEFRAVNPDEWYKLPISLFLYLIKDNEKNPKFKDSFYITVNGSVYNVESCDYNYTDGKLDTVSSTFKCAKVSSIGGSIGNCNCSNIAIHEFNSSSCVVYLHKSGFDHKYISKPEFLGYYEIVNKQVRVSEKTAEYYVQDNQYIMSDVPLMLDYETEELTIKGTGNLVLEPRFDMQPCIGTKTNTGMSYGRWSPNIGNLKKITIDCAHVLCMNKEDAFSIGSYNDDKVPEIELISDGSIICPEVTGNRVLVHKAFPPDGSTKISDSASYKIVDFNADGWDLFSDEQRAIAEKILEISPNINIEGTTELKNLSKALSLLELNNNLDVSLLLNGTRYKNLMQVTNAIVLGFTDMKHITGYEALFEAEKLTRLLEKYNIEDTEYAVINLWRKIVENYGTEVSKLSGWDIKYIYESIPAYFFTFEGTELDNVKRYLKDGPVVHR